MSLFSLILGLIIGFVAATETDKIRSFVGIAKDKAIDSLDDYIGRLAERHQAKKAAKNKPAEEPTTKPAEETATKTEEN